MPSAPASSQTRLFPTYVRADDVISAGQKPVRARLILRFSKHEKVRDSAPAPER